MTFVKPSLELSIRAARANDLPDIMAVLEAAKGIMRASGNTLQWVGGYPSEEVILQDIDRGYGQVVMAEGRIAGYFAFIPSPEPTYATIYDGAWLDDSRPYHVVHRIGSYPEDANIRIDTHRDNRIMQHNILKYGFRYCGIIYLASGDERLAYQRIIGDNC